MTTMSFSVEDELKKDFESWAKHAKKSKSDLFRDMLTIYRFNRALDAFSVRTAKAMEELTITSEEELYDYLESDDTYEDRLRHQRLSRSN